LGDFSLTTRSGEELARKAERTSDWRDVFSPARHGEKHFRATVAQLTVRLDEQAAQIQKVSAQLEASKPAPQVANNR
jgi:hypothetical protein